MAYELLATLARLGWMLTLVLCAVLLAGRLLRAHAGAAIAYLAWLAVPMVLVLALTPQTRVVAASAALAVPLQALSPLAPSVPRLDPAVWQVWAALAWLGTCLLLLGRTWRGHARFRERLGPLQRRGDFLHFDHPGEGPVVAGLWCPVILLPADFAGRYTPAEQALILAHESVHVRRRDPLANALCALVQCVFWFHPLVHLAARRFRLDQELACDALVMRAHPAMRRSYAEAMFKTQLSSQAGLAYCHWRTNHPLKERVMQLQQHPPTAARRLAGRVFVSMLVFAAGCGALASKAAPAQGASKTSYLVAMKLSVNGGESAPRLHVKEGEPFALTMDDKGGQWRGDFVLARAGTRQVTVKGEVKMDGRTIAAPSVLVALDEPAAIGMTDAAGKPSRLEFTVSELPAADQADKRP